VPTLTELRQFARYHLLRRAHDHPAREQELGVVSLGYDPAQFEREVRAFDGAGFAVSERARVEYRGVQRGIFRALSTNAGRARKRLLILSGVHGNEHAGILSVPRALERFRATHGDGDRVALCVLTPVNPIGAAEDSRFNAQGYDINRDFVRFDTVEARVVRETMDELRPDFVLSLHEGPQDASFMFANAHVDAALAERLLLALEAGGTKLATHDYFGSRLRRPGLSPSSRAGRAVVRLWALSLSMMASNAFSEGRGVPELVLESSWRNPDRAERLRAHTDLCAALCDELAR
jgi:Succinylglutamate desuccinylase / Aspartoacylase family